MVKLSRQGSDTIRPGGASDDLGIAWSSILLRRGALEKKSRSRVTDSISVVKSGEHGKSGELWQIFPW